MSDAELIARLRAYREHDEGSGGMASFEVDECIEAADRIETLNKERDEAINQLDSARYSVDVLEKRVAFVEKERKKTFQALLKTTKIHDEAEANLAKAVEALENVIGEYDLFRKYEYERGLAPLDDEIHEACATLAEIKGESHE